MTGVRIEGLGVRYDATVVLDGIDLTLADGEFVFLLGPSGCGKTTLLRSVAGFVEPCAGRILFDDQPVTRVPPEQRGCGMVFQNYALWPHLSVLENVAFGLDVRRVPREEKRRRALEALRLVRMEALAARTPNRLSGGQQQRVALARALVIEPRVLLLDEPLSNLDAALRLELRTEIRRVQRATGRTSLYVTHDRAEALALADRIAVLRGGRIEQLGRAEDLYDHPVSPFVAGFLGDVNRLSGRFAEGATGSGLALVTGDWGSIEGRRLGAGHAPGTHAPGTHAGGPPAAGGAVAAARPGGRARPGDAAVVLLRPERLVLHPWAGAGPGRLAGRVRERLFLGETVQHEVELAGGATVRALALGTGGLLDAGQAVAVEVTDAMVFAGAAGPDEPGRAGTGAGSGGRA